MIAEPTVEYRCLNGPCEGATVHAPIDASPGTACAIAWKTVKAAPRFAVYVLIDWNGQGGLMYIGSYPQPHQAQWKVERLTAICAAQVS